VADQREVLGFNKSQFADGTNIIHEAREDLNDISLEPVQVQAVERFIAGQLMPFLSNPLFDNLYPGSRFMLAQLIERVALGMTLVQVSVDRPVTRLSEYGELRETGRLGSTKELEVARERLARLPQEFKGKK